jgi:hypothetical protein
MVAPHIINHFRSCVLIVKKHLPAILAFNATIHIYTDLGTGDDRELSGWTIYCASKAKTLPFHNEN